MKTISVPKREEVSENNQAIFDNLKNKLGFVPNLYATYAHNQTALADYLALQNRKSTLKAKEREIINLVVSQINDCSYCLAAHTAIAKINGFSDEEILSIREGTAPWNEKFNALADFVKSAVLNRSKPSSEAIENLFSVGYNEDNLVDIIIVIGDKMISNFIHGATKVPIDFPAAPALELVS